MSAKTKKKAPIEDDERKMAGAGHNRVGGIDNEKLTAIIERVERLEEEKATITSDIKDVFTEANGNGFDCKALRTIVRMRKQDPNDRAEQETVLELYMQAMGMI